MENLLIFIVFASAFLSSFLLGAAINCLAYKYLGIQLLPKKFFEFEQDTWKKW